MGGSSLSGEPAVVGHDGVGRAVEVLDGDGPRRACTSDGSMPSTPATGATAAKVSAIAHARRCDMKPPFDMPVA